jgi:peptidoglycan/xylan/chitin deacetylase (PgdA/CDA1 family)
VRGIEAFIDMSSEVTSNGGGDRRRWKRLAGAMGAPLARAITHAHGRVLMYHRFGAGTHRRLDPRAFEQHLRYLVRHFDVRPLSSIAGSPTRLQRQAVALTVDDGYADFAEHAYPLIRRYEVPVTVFVVTRFADNDFWLWFDAVHYLLHATRVTRANVVLGARRFTLDLSSTAARDAAWSVVGARCLLMDPARRQTAIDRLGAALDVPLPACPTPAYRAMSWGELRALDPELVTIGSHTRTHPVLSRCDVAEIAREVRVSKQEIAARLGREVDTFCYPNGQPEDYDVRCVQAVRAAGYRCATVAHGALGAGGDPYRVRRIAAPFTLPEFQRAVDGVTNLADQWRAWRFGTAS